uniref:Nudix hydrolase domain-containing protein n=1 Tax=Thermogemmatispora argillosa TaxID=2045280 RepID=A0A455SXB9_9CHLR|nr:hypothetical protein KTA_04150 [Thermogemmatispora argillosa]
MPIDYYDDPAALKANTILPATWAIIEDEEGQIFLQQRQEDGLGSLSGGVRELEESMTQALVQADKGGNGS